MQVADAWVDGGRNGAAQEDGRPGAIRRADDGQDRSVFGPAEGAILIVQIRKDFSDNWIPVQIGSASNDDTGITSLSLADT